jgi:hypothetical protein
VKAGDLLTSAPLIALTLTSITVMLAAAFWRSHVLAFLITLAGLATTFARFVAASRARVTPLVAMILRPLLHRPATSPRRRRHPLVNYLHDCAAPEEYYVCCSRPRSAGLRLWPARTASFPGLEILSVSLYALIVTSTG